MFADAYNWAAREHREIGMAHKFPQFHEYTGILDFERGRADKITVVRETHASSTHETLHGGPGHPVQHAPGHKRR
jgi:hypothetical protein